MRTLSILRWTVIGKGVPLGGCLQKSGLPPLEKIKRERERKKRERKLCNLLCSALLPACYSIWHNAY